MPKKRNSDSANDADPKGSGKKYSVTQALTSALKGNRKATNSLTKSMDLAVVALGKISQSGIVPPISPKVPGPPKTPGGKPKPSEPEDDKDEPGEEGSEDRTFTDRLTSALQRNIESTFSLTSMFSAALKSQEQILKVFVTAGQSNEINMHNLSDTFSQAGLSMAKSLEQFTEMTTMGLEIGKKQNRESIGRFGVLGKDMKSATKAFALNTKTLGMSDESARVLSDSMIAAAATYGMNTDVLIKAISSLAKTILQSAVVYGKGTSEALQKATLTLVGKFGAANEAFITEGIEKIFGGTKESTILASQLGLSIDKLNTTDPNQMVAMFSTAMENLQARVGSAQGTGAAGISVNAILEALNATPGLLAMANLEPLTVDAIEANDAATKAAEVAESARLSIETIMKDIQIAVMPIVSILGKVIAWFVPLLTHFKGLGGKILAIGILFKAASMISMAIGRKQVALASQANLTLKQIAIKNSAGGMAGGMLGGPWGMLASVVVGVGMAVYSHHQSQKEEAKALLEEQTKTTEAVVSNKTNQLLGNLSSHLQQANIYHLRAALIADQHKEVAEEQLVVAAEAVNTSNVPIDQGFEMDLLKKTW